MLLTSLILVFLLTTHDKIIARSILDNEKNEINATSQVEDVAVGLNTSENFPSNIKQYKERYHKPNEITQNEFDKLLAKKSLGDFIMSRRKTLVTLPDVDYRDRNDNCRTKCRNRRLNTYEYSTEIDASRHKNLLAILTKQMAIVEKLVDHLNQTKIAARQGKSEFDELLESIKTKTTVRVTTETEKRTTQEISTVMSLIDETVIRRALKKDPLVSRILNKAKRKRERYFKEMQNYY